MVVPSGGPHFHERILEQEEVKILGKFSMFFLERKAKKFFYFYIAKNIESNRTARK